MLIELSGKMDAGWEAQLYTGSPSYSSCMSVGEDAGLEKENYPNLYE